MEVLDGVKGISFIRMDEKDIVRHKLVTRIVNAYDRYEENRELKRINLHKENEDTNKD